MEVNIRTVHGSHGIYIYIEYILHPSIKHGKTVNLFNSIHPALNSNVKRRILRDESPKTKSFVRGHVSNGANL